MGDDSWAHGVAFFVDQMVLGRGRWGQRFVWEERLGTTRLVLEILTLLSGEKIAFFAYHFQS